MLKYGLNQFMFNCQAILHIAVLVPAGGKEQKANAKF